MYKPIPDLGYRPTVSVIVPAKNEEEVIQKTINAILDSDYPQDKLEVIVIDDGSTDNTAAEIQKIRSARITFIKNEKNLGKRISLAKGFMKSTGEIVVCVDSDSFVQKDAITLMMQPFTKPDVMAVCGHGRAANFDANLLSKLQHFWYQEMFRLIKGMESIYGCVTCCSGILSAYRREAVKKTLDEWYNESLVDAFVPKNESFIMRIMSKSQADDRTLTVNILAIPSAKVVYQSNAIVGTIVPENMKQFVRQQLRWNRAWMYGTAVSAKFMWKKRFPVPLYFYGYHVLIAVLNPAVVITWLIIKPLQGVYTAALLFMVGTIYIAILHGLNIYRYDKTTIACIPYRCLFAIISVIQSAILVPFAWLTVWDGAWSTRSGKSRNNGTASSANGNPRKSPPRITVTSIGTKVAFVGTGILLSFKYFKHN
ncbi:MAG: glycosyltransferase family 2 protein [Candidatus Methanoperedens sp.]|nr:glycosyltransferase family 2 protein [Candidatus Methanoperedens sp.]